MDKKFQVLVEKQTLHRSQRGSITGVIAVRAGGIVFPEDRWSDFPVVVLGWWINECRRIRTGGTARCQFMDGPYRFSIRITGGANEAEIELPAANSAPLRVDLADVLEEIRGAARVILATCDAAGWNSTDIETLRSRVT